MAPTRETSDIAMLFFFLFGITNAAVGDMAAGPAFALLAAPAAACLVFPGRPEYSRAALCFRAEGYMAHEY